MGEEDVITPPGCSPHVREYLVRVTDIFATHDVDFMVRELLDPEVEWIDHRPLGAEPIRGLEETATWMRSIFEMVPDWRIRVTVLAQDGDVYLAHDMYSGEQGDAFGATALDWYVVDVLRGGRLLREEIFAEEADAREAFERLRAA